MQAVFILAFTQGPQCHYLTKNLELLEKVRRWLPMAEPFDAYSWVVDGQLYVVGFLKRQDQLVLDMVEILYEEVAYTAKRKGATSIVVADAAPFKITNKLKRIYEYLRCTEPLEGRVPDEGCEYN